MTQLTEDLLSIGKLLARHSDGRIRIAINEADTTRDFDPEAQEHLKVHEQRVGRDFRLYAFMAQMMGSAHAIADFACVLSAAQQAEPDAFEVAREQVNGLERYFDDEQTRTKWRALFVPKSKVG